MSFSFPYSAMKGLTCPKRNSTSLKKPVRKSRRSGKNGASSKDRNTVRMRVRFTYLSMPKKIRLMSRSDTRQILTTITNGLRKAFRNSNNKKIPTSSVGIFLLIITDATNISLNLAFITRQNKNIRHASKNFRKRRFRCRSHDNYR